MPLEVDDLKIDALSGVLKASTGTVSGGATTADLPESTDKKYITDVQQVFIAAAALIDQSNRSIDVDTALLAGYSAVISGRLTISSGIKLTINTGAQLRIL